MCYSYFMDRRKRNTKDNLIPLEKRRRTIRLERRGRKKLSTGAVLTGLLAAACLLYCLCIFFFMGYGTRFFLIWGVLAVFFGVWAVLLGRPDVRRRIPRWVRAAFMACVVLGLSLFLAVEGMIFSQFGARAQGGADYVIVLGAQWKSHGPSYVLQKRLDRAAEYLRENPDTYVIVSGGQGGNEPIPEAEGMAGYLAEAGIEEHRILRESASTNTEENLRFSSVFLEKEQDRVVLVSSNFHMFRSLQIAKKQGYREIEGLAADSYPAMLPNNLLREFFGVVKDFCVGNL